MKITAAKIFLSSEKGFSLIELAIVMIIISLLTLPLLQRYKIYTEQEKIDNTTIALNNLNSALGEFYVEHGYYPCPADRSIPLGEPHAGEAQCGDNSYAVPAVPDDPNKFAALGPNSCSSGKGICSVTGNPGKVYTGGIPYVTLDIPYTQMIDGDKNPISYSVTAAFADHTQANDTARIGSVSMKTDTINPATGAVSTTPTDNIYYMLVSYGENGAGSFNLQGIQNPCPTGTLETENCNLDATFLDRGTIRSYADNADYYDDRISPVAYAPTSIWALSMDTPGAIYNTNAGAIGIGTKTPDTAVKLDVAGDVRAQQFRGDHYCDQSGSNCFIPSSVAGDPVAGTGGKDCPAGEYLTTVSQNNWTCRKMAVGVIPQTCGTNQYVSGIQPGTNGQGKVVCKDLPQ